MLMKNFLRFSFVALMAMVFVPSFAEDIIWQEDYSSYKADDVPTGGTYSYACENGGGTTKIYEAALAGGASPELLVAKKGGSFTAVVPLNGKSGEINISYVTNRAELSIEVTGATVGEKSRVGNADNYSLTVNAGTESLTIKIYMPSNVSSNARLDNIKLYQGTAKKPAGLSWGKASTTVTLGGDYANIPTLQNANNLPVECKTSNDSVCTVTNEGVISVVGAGTATISAIFAGNDEYEAQTVSIDIKVNPAVNPDAKGGQNNPYLISDQEFLTMVEALNDSTTKPKSATIYVKGYITNVEEVSTEHGNATFKIAAENKKDADIKLKVFRFKYLEKSSFTAEDQIKEGDEVVVCGQIQWYYSNGKGEPQFAQGGYIYSLNGNTTSHINNVKMQNRFSGAIYNLKGQRVQTMSRGLYIKDGKKFFVK